ncbi:MAG: hypothetical protein KKD77_20940 [Gammaproteobacteria bacterium]|nr:hypothetical protein [Gammaproteobacteria bacterium]
MSQTCGEEHGRVCGQLRELENLWPYLKDKLPRYVFVWAVIACTFAFGALSGWIGYVQGVSADERRIITTKYDARFDKLTESINLLNLEIVKLTYTLKGAGNERKIIIIPNSSSVESSEP